MDCIVAFFVLDDVTHHLYNTAFSASCQAVCASFFNLRRIKHKKRYKTFRHIGETAYRKFSCCSTFFYIIGQSVWTCVSFFAYKKKLAECSVFVVYHFLTSRMSLHILLLFLLILLCHPNLKKLYRCSINQ